MGLGSSIRSSRRSVRDNSSIISKPHTVSYDMGVTSPTLTFDSRYVNSVASPRQSDTYDPYGYDGYIYDEDINNHQVALERKFNNYDYQDLGDVKIKSLTSAKIRASISGAATIKSNGSKKTSKSSKSAKHYSSAPQDVRPPNARRYSLSSAVSSKSQAYDSMSINMQSVALSSIYQKHMHCGVQNDQSVHTNYDKHKVRMHSEKKAFGSKTPYDMANQGHEDAQSISQAPLYSRYKQQSGLSRSIHSGHSSTSNYQNHQSRRSSRYNNTFDNRSTYSDKSTLSRRRNRSGPSSPEPFREDKVLRKASAASLGYDDDDLSLNDVFESTRAPLKVSSNSSTPVTLPENLPLNKTTKFDGATVPQGNHLTSITEVATPKDSMFRLSNMYQSNQPVIAEEKISRKNSLRSLTRKTSKVSVRSRTSNNNSRTKLDHIPGSPKAVFNLEDTLRADMDFTARPSKEEFKKSVGVNLTKQNDRGSSTTTNKRKKESSGLGGFFRSLFGKKQKGIDKSKIQVLNQRIGVY